MEFIVTVPHLFHVTILDTGVNLKAIKRELRAAGIKNINIIHNFCTTDRGDQDLGYMVIFTTTNESLVFNLLNHHCGYCCEYKAGDTFYDDVTYPFVYTGTIVAPPSPVEYNYDDPSLPF